MVAAGDREEDSKEDSDKHAVLPRNESPAAAPDCHRRRAPSRPSSTQFGAGGGNNGRVTTNATVNSRDSEEDDAGSAELTMAWYAGGRMTVQSPLVRRLIRGGSGPESAAVGAAGGDAATTAASVLPLSDDDAAPVTETKNLVKKAAAAVQVGIAKSSATIGTLLELLARPEENGPDSSSRVKDDVGESQAVNTAAATATATTTATATAAATDDDCRYPSVRDASAAGAAAGAATATAGADGGCPYPSVSDASAVDPSVGDSRIGDGHRCEDDAVLLFCRLPKEPYVFCGRVRYAEHWPGEQPLRFAWRLLDAGRLAGCPDFGAIVEAAGVEAARYVTK